jgi:hypothetical protein
MPAASALLEQNTYSETLMDALPALHRVVRADNNHKVTFIVTLQYWMTFKGKRTSAMTPRTQEVLQLLADAQRAAVSNEERNALEVISAGWKYFAPAEFLLGCT